MVTLISITSLNWKTFLANGQQLLNKHLGSTADISGYPQTDLRALISSLEDFAIAGDALAHIVVGFWVKVPSESLNELIVTTKGHHLLGEKSNLIVQSTLEEWKMNVLRLCNHSHDIELRRLGNEIYLLFEKANIADWIWPSQVQVLQENNLFTLEG